VNSPRRTLDEPRWGVVIPFKIDWPAARIKSGKSLVTRRIERLQRVRLILDMMQRDSLGFREVGAKFGISGPMAFKLVKELRQNGEQGKDNTEASSY
jgi:hypothetical protein